MSLVAAALLTTATLVSGALAQTPEPDTDFTPVPKQSGEWAYVGGSEFGETDLPGESATPHTVDFFATAFANEARGAYVGAQCKDTDTQPEELDACERRPAIYEYSVAPGRPATVTEVLGSEASGESEPGYVASVAWIDAGHAIAVGGTGNYPRRELEREQGESDADYAARDLAGSERNAAGRARTWLLDRDRFGDTDWHEIDVPPDADGEPTHGLTAVDCSPRLAIDGRLCVAGGMRQLWFIEEGRFVESFTPTSEDESGEPTVDDGPQWRFRVRAVRFAGGPSVPASKPSVVAVTSGCCTGSELENAPRVLLFKGGKWVVRLLAYSGSARNNIVDGLLTPQLGFGPTAAADSTQRSVRPRQSVPDSYYALNSELNTVVATPGGPGLQGDDRVSEPPSRLIKFNPSVAEASLVDAGTGVIGLQVPCLNNDPSGSLCNEVTDPSLSDLRLVAGDGDFDRPSGSTVVSESSGGAASDGLMDWAVGSFGSTGPGHHDRAAAYATTRSGNLTPNPLECTLLGLTVDCGPRDSDETAAETRSQSIYSLPTYALNAFAFTPGGAIGWAAGDRGAILRLGGEGTVASQANEPTPPRLGGRQAEDLPETGPYDVSRPDSASNVGEVPALGDRPSERLEEPELIPVGTPSAHRPAGGDDSVRSIVMSRDGSEGWAFGGEAKKGIQGSIFHYDGNRWRRCEASGIPGQTEPDPACSGLGVLHEDRPVQMQAAVRVPLEHDSDPTNDDEFEVLALGTEYTLPGDDVERRAVFRYRNGRWTLDAAAMREIDPGGTPSRSPDFVAVAFTEPDNGWALAGNVSGAAGMELFRFDGTGWLDCGASGAARTECGDPTAVLPLDQASSPTRPFILAAAGSQVYLAGTRSGASTTYPFILSLDTSQDGSEWVAEHDPGCPDPGSGQCVGSEDSSDQGWVSAFSVARGEGGRNFGWAAGLIGRGGLDDSDPSRGVGGGSEAALLRLAYDKGGEAVWRPYSVGDAADDYLFAAAANSAANPTQLLSLLGESGEGRSFLAPANRGRPALHPMLTFSGSEGTAGSWSVFPAPFALSPRFDSAPWNALAANVQAMAADGQGGFWLAARRAPTTGAVNVFFYHYTDRRPTPVFDDVPHPIRETITDASGTADGQLWVSTDAGVVYRYDRLTGWDRLRIPGWDPGQVVTRTSGANAIAFGSGGEGVVVGEGGRIADVGRTGATLNPAAGAAPCSAEDPTPPCGTGSGLLSAAVAPDGSALVGGDRRTLLFRPAGGEFRAVPAPLTAVSAAFTGIAMPSPAQAWISTSIGEVFAGERVGSSWSWRLENVNADGDLVTLDTAGQGIRLNAVAADASGHGYAVGNGGLLLERGPAATHRWRRVDSGVRENLLSVALPQGQGAGALIGGELGLILTLRDGQLEVARAGEFTEPINAGQSVEHAANIAGLMLLPGVEPGQVEAWAVSQNPGNGGHRRPVASAILHYTNAPEEPLLRSVGRARPLDDVPPAYGDLSLAAFGRSDCHLESAACIEAQGTNFVNEITSRRIVSELRARNSESGKADIALFTGDVNRAAGRDSASSTPLDVDVMHRRWVELVAGRFASAGIPLFGAIGVQDLSQVKACPPLTAGRCFSSRQVGAGTSEPWRASFAKMPAPWGGGPATSSQGLTFKAVSSQGDEARGGGARTHYAIDVVRGADPIARLIVLDNSLRSLAASTANQNPVEDQAEWLDEVLASRPEGARAIVVSNTPSYSPNTEASGGGVETATDQAAFEQILLDNDVDVVISGRLGWNGVYWTLAPGLHYPCPGGGSPDPDKPPAAGSAPGCGPAGGDPDLLDPDSPLGSGGELDDAMPTIVASGAGGTFGPVNRPVDGPASEGFWHGYSIVHLDTETGRVRFEQRPVFDWIGLTAPQHLVHPKQRLKLNGFGREVAGADTPLRYDEIDSHAVTHRYDLLVADPEEPWLPLQADAEDAPTAQASSTGAGSNPCRPYICLDKSIGTVDRITGEVEAGEGDYPRIFAIALLSVGEKTATWPLAFEPRPSFRPAAAAPPPQPASGAAPAPPPPAGQPPIPEVPKPTFPEPPLQPSVPPIVTQAALTPTPPAPPAPPGTSQSASLDLFATPEGISIAPQTTVPPPPPPPVNPAPPGGARREARQRQAATQKSGAETGSEEAESEGVDPEQSQSKVNPMDSPELGSSRQEPGRQANAFTAVGEYRQPSAWSRGALYGGGITLGALILALGWGTLRPTPRRRQPPQAAPAWAGRRARR